MDGTLGTVIYAIVCVVAPAIWGVAMYFAFGWLKRRLERRGKDQLPPVDYSI